MLLNRLSRRQLLLQTPSALLAAGLWPGTLSAKDSDTSEFSFLVVNDLHSFDKKCKPWFEKLVAQMRNHAEKPSFLMVAGDLAQDGKADQLGAVKEIFAGLKLPMYVVPGNHDFTPQKERKHYDELFPDQLNYTFDRGGWQFISLDSTEATKYQNTTIAASTLKWMDQKLPKIDKKKPLVVMTHFPMGEGVSMRPTNADDVLKRFLDFNLRAVFSGHFHGFTEKKAGEAILTTNRCCAISRGNHDGTKEKGYFLVTAKDGKLKRTFVEVKAS